MITERDIAEKFTIIWKQHFPLLSPNFMRVFNEGQIQVINSKPVPLMDNVRYDLASEAAFNLSSEIFHNHISPNDYLNDKNSEQKLILDTATTIWKTNFNSNDLIITQSEKTEIVDLTMNIIEFINNVKEEKIFFKPKLKGFGVIPDLEADLSIGDTLYEIKTVNRNFKSSDIKQLFIYLALQQVSGSMNWKYGGLYNPRRGTYCRFNIRSLVYNLSGGGTPNEVFESFLNNMSRDVKIDSRF